MNSVFGDFWFSSDWMIVTHARDRLTPHWSGLPWPVLRASASHGSGSHFLRWQYIKALGKSPALESRVIFVLPSATCIGFDKNGGLPNSPTILGSVENYRTTILGSVENSVLI